MPRPKKATNVDLLVAEEVAIAGPEQVAEEVEPTEPTYEAVVLDGDTVVRTYSKVTHGEEYELLAKQYCRHARRQHFAIITR